VNGTQIEKVARLLGGTRRLVTGLALSLAVGFAVGTLCPAQAWSADDVTDPSVAVRMRLNQAKKIGAKGQLPIAYWDLDSRLDEAEKNGASEREWASLRDDVQRLLNRAELVNRMRLQKSAVEALLGRFDQSLAEIAALSGVELDPLATGPELSRDLLDKLGTINLQKQVRIDSLTVANRRLSEIASGPTAVRDSMMTSLQVEVSALRKKLWETELRVGVAEADRSAAETVLTAKQQREEVIAALRSKFSADEAEILLTPAGGAILRVYGIAFAVGSSEVQAGQTALVAKVADVLQVFPGATIKVEGHTDNTGSRQANLRLSRRRAEAVARLLEDHAALVDGTIATDGFGPDRPLALNDSPEGRKLNRRIDVIIETQD
jgi:outer membrane protein OmpA-like peptidoglycan-associated protein